MRIVAALLIGLVFGCGILVSGMSNPAKVVNFFDVAGAWDPSLAFVMGGGLLVNIVGYRMALRRKAPLLMPSFSLPALTRVDAALVGGSAVFGVGWGLSGVCPGGLIPVLGIGRSEPLLFLAGLLAGIVVARQARTFLAARA
jgi:uncharacterized membrane protein YedE/YeeE